MLLKTLNAAILITFLISWQVSAQEKSSGDSQKKIVIPGIMSITASERVSPPDWAVMERQLIKVMNDAAPEFVAKYADRGGRMPQIGKPDDIYEDYANWPLFYALGGNEYILNTSIDEWNAITRQLIEAGQVDREFVVGYDWFHHSENYKNFYYFGLADPTIPENIARSKRFAEMYTGEDTLAMNYDKKHKIMFAPRTGAKGPAFPKKGDENVYLLNYGHGSLYPFVKGDFRPGWEKDPVLSKKYNELANDILFTGDYPVSLSSTALVANAYLYTGDEKFKKWVLEYTDAWMERIKENKGIIPDNIGPNGKIGELRKGQWWGGFFGWNCRYSQHMIFGAVTTAAETAYLVSGDPKYLGLLRSQLDVLLKNSKTQKGQLLVPYKYGAKGWFDYRPLELRESAHLYNSSMDSADKARIERILAGSKTGPRPYDHYNDYAMPVEGHLNYKWMSNGIPMDFTKPVSNGDVGDLLQEQEELNEAPRYLFLEGKNPGFPVKMLEADYNESLRRIAESRGIEDIYKVPNRHSEYVAELNPVVIKSLVYLTMGGPMAIYNGGLLQVRVRYFDTQKGRPGLPDDVGALVEKIGPDNTVLSLVNINAIEPRSLIVQAGAYGEHQFGEIKYSETTKDAAGKTTTVEKTLPVNNKYFEVELPPASSIKLNMSMKRHANRPSYDFPWKAATAAAPK